MPARQRLHVHVTGRTATAGHDATTPIPETRVDVPVDSDRPEDRPRRPRRTAPGDPGHEELHRTALARVSSLGTMAVGGSRSATLPGGLLVAGSAGGVALSG